MTVPDVVVPPPPFVVVVVVVDCAGCVAVVPGFEVVYVGVTTSDSAVF